MKPTTTLDMRSAVRTTVLSFGFAATLWLLGRGALTTPPVDSWPQFEQWLGDRSTAEAAIAALRATAVVAASYLGAVSALTIVAKLASFDQLDRLARSLVPRSVRPLVGLAVGVGVATAAASMTVPRDSSPTLVATATLESPSDATATMYFVTETVPPATLSPSTGTPGTPTTTILPASAALPEPAPPPATIPLPQPSVATAHTWTIAPGEHLWAVATETLTDSWHRAPTDSEVVPYWHALIETNRGRLIDSANPDYVLAGQTFVLPDVPTAPVATR
jgi:hypothetical protein